MAAGNGDVVQGSVTWSAFWRSFQTGGHAERPSLFERSNHPGLGVSIDAIFGATVNMSDRVRRMPRADRIKFSNIRFYIRGQRLEDPAEYLMRGTDSNFAGWHERLQAITNDYCIVFNRLESAFGDEITGIYDLLRPLVDEIGLPARKSEITLFAGFYKKTPFGIHNDDEVNFF